MVYKSIVGAVCACLFITSANAAIVTYIVEGDLSKNEGPSDLFNLDGAHYIHEIVVDTSVAYSDFRTGDLFDYTDYNSGSGAWVSSTMTLTNRPNGASDTTVTANQYTPLEFHIQNIYEEEPFHNVADAIAVGGAELTGEFQGLKASGLFYFFTKSYFPGAGPVALPDEINRSDLYLPEELVSWYYKDERNRMYTYLVSNGEIYTSPIPIPASVWLFSSGLIGLIGLARRKS